MSRAGSWTVTTATAVADLAWGGIMCPEVLVARAVQPPPVAPTSSRAQQVPADDDDSRRRTVFRCKFDVPDRPGVPQGAVGDPESKDVAERSARDEAGGEYFRTPEPIADTVERDPAEVKPHHGAHHASCAAAPAPVSSAGAPATSRSTSAWHATSSGHQQARSRPASSCRTAARRAGSASNAARYRVHRLGPAVLGDSPRVAPTGPVSHVYRAQRHPPPGRATALYPHRVVHSRCRTCLSRGHLRDRPVTVDAARQQRKPQRSTQS